MEKVYSLIREGVDTWVCPCETELKTAWFGLAIMAYFILTSGVMAASYGRHFSENSFVPSMNGKLGWTIMEIVSPIVLVLFFNAYQRPGRSGSMGHVLMSLWLLHYLNRSVLSVLLSPGMKSTRVDTVIQAATFNLVNAGWIGHDLGFLNSQPFTFTPRNSFGLVAFILGMAINISSDYHLQSLRRRKGSGGEYVLPEWGLFKYIVSPNYAGEFLEWTGFATLLGQQSGWAFVVWTLSNLVPRARSNLVWYKNKFGDKVGNRKSVIPCVF
jgi:hypothetical protein